ncbi:ribosome small subunit-dependent GTPase A [Thiomicrorhabdus indica]|uniref:ribosome small subunit-dependent GTPase A n=1 Tax=Thiomicrorhabdus indica TaxID=2267253 RepID=UPI00102E020A|nr:ribosome small subunit-dependent GTPase A [Thiomicrorhabdus indica]
MAKRRLNKKQIARIQEKRQATQTLIDESQLSDEQQKGLIITSFGKRVLLENQSGEQFSCAIRQGLGKLVAGDEVVWQEVPNTNEGVVTQLLARHHELSRPGFRGQKRMIASNIDFIGIVMPVVPGIHPDMIDRYLVAASQLDIPVIIIINKVDLLSSDEEWEMVAELLHPYAEMGIEILPASSVSEEGLRELREFMDQKNSVLVGASGAGKSSLINALIPDLDIRVGELSEATGLGKHTTTNSILYHLPSLDNETTHGGNLIDSPGVRQFSPNPCSLTELETHYPDFASFLGQCKYNNCTHSIEPHCAIKQAVEDDEIALSRYESFRRLLEEFENESS